MRVPYPYQETAVDWLAARKAALLALEMGLGKTGVAIRAADELKLRRILVICPAVAITNWIREFQAWQLVARTLGGIYQSKDRPKTDVVIVNYDKVSIGAVDDLLARDWELVILDEAHYLKTPMSKRVAKIYGNLYGPVVNPRQGGVVSRARYVWLLTATPIPNNVSELWTHLRAVAPERLPTGPNDRPVNHARFIERYCEVRDTLYGPQILGNRKDALPHLRMMLNGFILRRRKVDVLPDLPPLRFATTVIEPDGVDQELTRLEHHPEILDLYATLEAAQAAAELKDGNLSADEKADLLEKLANRPGHVATLRRLTSLCKVAPTITLLSDELRDGLMDKVVLFAVHRETIDRLAEGLALYGCVKLHGGIGHNARQVAIDTFQNDPATRVFVAQVQAAGTAINLTAADNVVFAEASWVPSDNAQAAARCHRIGTTRPVLARFLALAGSIDELVQQTLARKTRAISEVLTEETQTCP